MGHLDRWNLGCAESGEVDVVILGSSIFYGVLLQSEDTLGPQLTGHLTQGTQTPCVVNLSQPGSSTQIQEVSLQVYGADIRPKVVVWEIWQNSPNQFVVLGDSAYNFGRLTVDAEGLPNLLGLPPALNRDLFTRSAAFRYFTLIAAKQGGMKSEDRWQQFTQSTLAPAVERLRGQGIEVLLVFTPPLSGPFENQVLKKKPSYMQAAAWATQAGVPWVDLAHEFGDTDPVTVRNDPCCHYNAAGTALVAQIVAPSVGALLE
jgi:hypothetical protein